MHRRFLVFLSILTLILGGAGFYVGTRLLSLSEWAAQHEHILWTLLIASIALQFAGLWARRKLRERHRHTAAAVHWMTYIVLGIFGCLVLYLFLADIGFGFARWALKVDISAQSELVTVLAAVALTTAIGVVQVALGPRVYRVEIPLMDLPATLDGFRIVQITDVHLGVNVGDRFMRKVVDISNALEPHVVALTGDLVDGSVAQLRQAIAPIATLRARHGVFAITGNHEYYSGVEQWLDEFRRLGARTLNNEHVLLRHGDSQLVLAGVTDYSTRTMPNDHASDPHRAIAAAPADLPRVLLAHNPSSYTEATKAGFHLQLSGHTHGGQFFPFSLLVRLVHRYYKGLSRHENLWIYVSRGTGYWGPPLRFGVPAEVTLITLRQSPIN